MNTVFIRSISSFTVNTSTPAVSAIAITTIATATSEYRLPGNAARRAARPAPSTATLITAVNATVTNPMRESAATTAATSTSATCHTQPLNPVPETGALVMTESALVRRSRHVKTSQLTISSRNIEWIAKNCNRSVLNRLLITPSLNSTKLAWNGR